MFDRIFGSNHIRHIEGVFFDYLWVVGLTGNRSDGAGISLQSDAKLLQDFCCNSTCSNSADGFTSGGTSAASVVPDTIFAVKAIVSMPWPVCICYITIIM